jgi:hypothetical protein
MLFNESDINYTETGALNLDDLGEVVLAETNTLIFHRIKK